MVRPESVHRSRISDEAVVEGDVRLVIAVGRAAKESVVTWIEAHGGTAQPESLHTASLGSLPSRVPVVGVPHPGSAASESTAAIKADYVRAVGHVRDWLLADPAGFQPTPASRGIWQRRSSTPRWRYLSGTLRSDLPASGVA